MVRVATAASFPPIATTNCLLVEVPSGGAFKVLRSTYIFVEVYLPPTAAAAYDSNTVTLVAFHTLGYSYALEARRRKRYQNTKVLR